MGEEQAGAPAMSASGKGENPVPRLLLRKGEAGKEEPKPRCKDVPQDPPLRSEESGRFLGTGRNPSGKTLRVRRSLSGTEQGK